MTRLTDKHQRKIDYLRISITDHCNLKCLYCNPFEERPKLPAAEILSYEEIFEVVKAAVSLGFIKIRITGGEPLMRKNILQFCRLVAELPQIKDLAISTNGILLADMASDLKKAGVKRVNISLDSLRASRYLKITGKNCMKQVLAGIEKAAAIGLTPVRINMIPMQGINEDEIVDMARWTQKAPYDIRFIELMPSGGWARKKYEELFIPAETVKKAVAAIGPLKPLANLKNNGPAVYFQLPHAKGNIGFITAMSHHFCNSCNRLRLTADGKLRPCLFDEKEFDVKQKLREGASFDQLRNTLAAAVAAKPQDHGLAASVFKPNNGRTMCAIGG